MNRTISFLIALVLVGLWLTFGRNSPQSNSQNQLEKTTIQAESEGVGGDESPEPSERTVRHEAEHIPPPTPTPAPSSPEPISIQTARRRAWESMPTTPKSMDEFYNLKQLSANHPPPTEIEARYFRGLRILNDKESKYIDMRFENDKWIISDGETPDQMVPWPPRDVIPFKDQRDVWTLYYGDELRVLLKHFPRVHIPELDGDFEVLSGWIFNRDIIYGGVVMISVDKTWPSEALFNDLRPAP